MFSEYSLLSLLLAVSTAFGATAPRIVLIGDSTVTAEKGWGGVQGPGAEGFCRLYGGPCNNEAVSGRTSVNWFQQPQWHTTQELCKTPGSYAVIQFGHNDQKVMNPTQFHQTLKVLVNKVQIAGCSPILATQLSRRTFASEHQVSDNLAPYAAQTRAVAAELSLPCIDLLSESLNYLNKLGRTAAKCLSLAADDDTHLNDLGRVYFGRMVGDLLAARVPQLAPYIKQNAALSRAIQRGRLVGRACPVG